jgi:ribonuclease HII
VQVKQVKIWKGKGPGIIGVDEAGRGPVIGPLVIAAVRVLDDDELVRVGARDSKELSWRKRENIFIEILEIADFSSRMISAEEIDELRKTKTMNEIEMDLFGQVVKDLHEDGDRVYVDAADVKEERFGQEISKAVGKELDITSRHRADSIYPAVSAASIIAKVLRDRMVREIEAWLRQTVDLPLGSGYPSDRVTIEFMENWIKQEGNLPPHTRRSWETAKRLLDKAKTTSLDDFGSDG